VSDVAPAGLDPVPARRPLACRRAARRGWHSGPSSA